MTKTTPALSVPFAPPLSLHKLYRIHCKFLTTTTKHPRTVIASLLLPPTFSCQHCCVSLPHTSSGIAACTHAWSCHLYTSSSRICPPILTDWKPAQSCHIRPTPVHTVHRSYIHHPTSKVLLPSVDSQHHICPSPTIVHILNTDI